MKFLLHVHPEDGHETWSKNVKLTFIIKLVQ